MFIQFFLTKILLHSYYFKYFTVKDFNCYKNKNNYNYTKKIFKLILMDAVQL